MIKKIDHVGIAVSNMEEACRFYEDVLEIKVTGTEEVKEQKVITAFLPVGDSEIELLAPTAPDSPIARFIEKRGEGIQHIALRVDDIEAELERLKAAGVRLIDEKPRRGAGGAKIAFIHPKATGGVLLEISEREE
ncbi:MAG: methylmalonyl-CoA epimerase [Firmicutes bacterium]|nr:methylmalonyl-CoA epimerase [Bacillota bacterium]